jgi:hypothetical protein
MKRTYVVIGNGVECPRCGGRTECREHIEITPKILKKKQHYEMWYVCVNISCPTKCIMPPEFIVKH